MSRFKHQMNEKEIKNRVRAIFGAITLRYDLLNRIMSMRRDVYWRREMVKHLPIDSRIVLDIATGTGDLAIEIARIMPEMRVYGIDFVPEMLDIARQKTENLDFERRIEYLLNDAMHLSFTDDSFDAATIAFGIRNIPDRLGAIKEMVRVVRPGGKVLILEMTYPGSRGMRRFFKFYLNRIIPLIGGLISRNFKAYRYLPDSILGFLHPDELSSLMTKAGMEYVCAYPLTFGITYIHEGVVINKCT